jgi:cytochrome c553
MSALLAVRPSVVMLVALVASTTTACLSLPDPVHDRAVERLGAEDAIGAGALHRAGQPCATCHGAQGPARTDFSIAGTIFDSPTSLVGVDGARVELVDAAGTSPPASSSLVTNCVGNFWVARAAWDPVFPVSVVVVKGDARRVMQSPIGRAASCADCHATTTSAPLTKVGAVTLFGGADPVGPSRACAVEPAWSAR